MPTRIFLAQCLARHEWPFWCPYLWQGFNHLGNGETGIFHPLRVAMYAGLPLTVAVAVETVLAWPILAWGAWRLARRAWGWPPVLAWGLAGLLCCNTFVLAHAGQVHLLWIMAHLPWLLLALEALRRGDHAGWAAAGFGGLLASMLLLCQPQGVYLIGLLVGLYWVARQGLPGKDRERCERESGSHRRAALEQQRREQRKRHHHGALHGD